MSARADVPGDASWMPAFLAMARELWVLKDRQRVLEALLQSQGIVGADAVDSYQPPPQMQAQIDTECRAFIDQLAVECTPQGSSHGA